MNLTQDNQPKEDKSTILDLFQEYQASLGRWEKDLVELDSLFKETKAFFREWKR